MCGTLALMAAAAQRRPTFSSDVAPLVYARCAGCHQPGDSGPFPLLSYDDARTRADKIVEAVASRQMPPWIAAEASGYPALRDDRRLQPRHIETFRNWVAAGMPAGDLTRAPWPPAFPMGWPLGVPNLTMTLPKPVSIPPGTTDIFFNVVFDLRLPEDRWLTAVDYRPTAAGMVSHAVFFAAPAPIVVGDEDALPGFAGLLGGGQPDKINEELAAVDRSLSTIGIWVKGMPPRTTPPGQAVHLPRGSNLIMQLHLRASDTGTVEDGQVALYFADKRPAVSLSSLQVPPAFGMAAGIDLPAGDPRIVVKDAFTLPVDVTAFGARGHANDLGRDLKMTAALPNGSGRGLLWVDRWDLRWQETFYFTAPVRLPRGTTIHVELAYDNSAGNPRQRVDPPRRVLWGPRLSDEVGSMELLIGSLSDADGAALAAARAEHLRRQLLRSVKR